MTDMLAEMAPANPACRDAAGVPPVRVQQRSWFAVGTAAFVLVVHAAGFGPSAVETDVRTGPPSPLVLAHAGVAAAWLLLFLTQTMLVATRHTATHRRLGVAGLFLTVAMALLIVPTVTSSARRGYDFSGDLNRVAFAPGASPTADERVEAATIGMLPPLLSTFSFALLVGAGLWYRRQPQIHSRLMLPAPLWLAGVPLLHLAGHAIRHWPSLHAPISSAAPLLGVPLLFVVAGRDWFVQRRIHPVSLWVPIALVVGTGLLVGLITPTATWRQLAEWLVG